MTYRALHGSLAGTPEMVMDLLDSLAAQLKPRAASDYNTMNDLKKKQGHKIKVRTDKFKRNTK